MDGKSASVTEPLNLSVSSMSARVESYRRLLPFSPKKSLDIIPYYFCLPFKSVVWLSYVYKIHEISLR